MYKLAIVDDEPLVQVAIKSMANWEEHNIYICGTAHNGKEALDLISTDMPHIVITDVKMPIMDGLELINECKRLYENPPVFIVLTNYDEFNLVQQALRLDAVDYVIKAELNEKTLMNCVKSAMKKVKKNTVQDSFDSYVDKRLFERQLLIRLLNGYYNSDKEIRQDIKDFSVSIEGKFYCVVFSKITSNADNSTEQHKIRLYNYTINMIQEILSRQFSVTTVPIDKVSFVVIITINNNDNNIKEAIVMANKMISNYFNVSINSGIGDIYNKLVYISDSYYEAMQAIRFSTKNKTVVLYSEIKKDEINESVLDIPVFQKTLIRATEELDVEKVESVLDEVLNLISSHTMSYSQTFDICCSILYLYLTMMDFAEELLENIFIDEKDGYKCIFRKNSIEALAVWFEKFKDGLVVELDKRKNSHSNQLVVAVQKYINNNYTKKLSLQEVASTFNISPNYLSSIFKEYTNINFSNYVSTVKIEHATEMLKNSDMQICEISDFLGFNDPYYFSKVFKKIIGLSPREYRIRMLVQ